MQNSNWYKFLKKIKSELISFSFLTGLFWFIRSPLWNSTELLQFEIEPKTIPFNKKFLKHIYNKAKHQYIWNFSPTQTIHNLEKIHKLKPYSLNFLTIRKILPPKLILYLREHQPVGILFDENFEIIQGLIDAEGNIFKNVQPKQIAIIEFLLNRPLLKIRGFENIKIRWSALYLLILRNPTTINEIYWDKENNILLGTEIGYVLFGEYQNVFHLQKRLLYMDKIYTLWKKGKLFSEVHVNLAKSSLYYIDLTENKTPIVSMLDSVSSYKIKDENYRWPSSLQDE
uniref:Cell division protein FtsQ n=1 Tax=Cyanophora sudae TaxID=1522369 RepID=A0A2Z4HG57_9EUKA|nr:cell division protein FtsQ [Cyanophora sudae]AWW13633.1 cell division protein FtsQ [Cyanophora sudae]